MKNILIGIDFGGTNIKIGCFDSDLRLIKKTSIETNVDTVPQAVVDDMANAAVRLVGQAGFSFTDVLAAGVGIPGPTDHKTGIIIRLPNLPLFKNVPFTKMLSDKLKIPMATENDANTACLGEFAVGSGKGVDDIVFFTLGTGIGGAIISGGRLIEGTNFGGAELGHIIIFPDGRKCACGQRGCVEAYASAASTARRATEAIEQGRESSLKKVLEKNGVITCKDVYEHLEQGDNLAKEITDLTAKSLALVCINMLHVTDPRKFIFAGGMIAADHLLLNRVRDYYNELLWDIKPETAEICIASLGEDAGITGAALMAKNLAQKA